MSCGPKNAMPFGVPPSEEAVPFEGPSRFPGFGSPIPCRLPNPTGSVTHALEAGRDLTVYSCGGSAGLARGHFTLERTGFPTLGWRTLAYAPDFGQSVYTNSQGDCRICDILQREQRAHACTGRERWPAGASAGGSAVPVCRTDGCPPAEGNLRIAVRPGRLAPA